ncbi:MAG: DUF3905 domain-containing protein [Kyrpidia sp.]|nr:DUF3905 domain-containing protein [Kyrpidia sp.]
MKPRRPAEQKVEAEARWRETPLDYWSVDVDPTVMSGEQWADGQRDPGLQTDENEALTANSLERKLRMGELFMHPIRDVTYRNE